MICPWIFKPFDVTVITFHMTLLMNDFTNTIMDDGRVHPLVKTILSLVINL